MCSYRFGAVRVTIAMNGICRYHGVVKGPKTLFRALSIRQARYMIDAALPAALIGDGLAGHHADRGGGPYLSFDAAGSTSVLPPWGGS